MDIPLYQPSYQRNQQLILAKKKLQISILLSIFWNLSRNLFFANSDRSSSKIPSTVAEHVGQFEKNHIISKISIFLVAKIVDDFLLIFWNLNGPKVCKYFRSRKTYSIPPRQSFHSAKMILNRRENILYPLGRKKIKVLAHKSIETRH